MLNFLIYPIVLLYLPRSCLKLGILNNCAYEMESENIINIVFPKQFLSKSHELIDMHITYIGEEPLTNLSN